MNQILSYKNSNIPHLSMYQKRQRYKLKKIFTTIFFTSIIVFIMLFSYFCIYLYNIYIKDKKARTLAQSFSVETLYNNNLKYSASTQINYNSLENELFIIGIIEIDKIGIHYPILSSATDDALKISPCRFAGPMPNSIGNLCIAGHNYIDNSFFGKLRLLNLGDTVRIYDLYGQSLDYSIFYKTEIQDTDFRFTSQKTNGAKIVTLMTCNSLKDTRLIYLAQETKQYSR